MEARGRVMDLLRGRSSNNEIRDEILRDPTGKTNRRAGAHLSWRTGEVRTGRAGEDARESCGRSGVRVGS